MIRLTRLNGRLIVLNAELIKMLEETPDTLVTLVNGDTLMVRETVEEVVERAVEFMRRIRGFAVVGGE